MAFIWSQLSAGQNNMKGAEQINRFLNQTTDKDSQHQPHSQWSSEISDVTSPLKQRYLTQLQVPPFPG